MEVENAAVQIGFAGQQVLQGKLSLLELVEAVKMALLKTLQVVLLFTSLGYGAVTKKQSGYASAPVVTVKNGTYEGRYEPAYGTDYFLGMPFAQPPVGT